VDFVLVLFNECLERFYKIGSAIPAILGNSSRRAVGLCYGVDDLLKGFLEIDKALAQLGVRDDWLGCLSQQSVRDFAISSGVSSSFPLDFLCRFQLLIGVQCLDYAVGNVRDSLIASYFLISSLSSWLICRSSRGKPLKQSNSRQSVSRLQTQQAP